MIEQFWNDEDSYVGPTYKAGVADAIAEFHEDLQPDELRRLIERGVDDSLAQVRRPFYLLSTQFYGDEYMRRALDDNAASIRRWAAKKLA